MMLLDEAAWRSEAMYLIGYALGALSSIGYEVNDELKERINLSTRTIEERLEALK